MYEVQIRRGKIVLRFFVPGFLGHKTCIDHEFDANGAAVLADELKRLVDELVHDEVETNS